MKEGSEKLRKCEQHDLSEFSQRRFRDNIHLNRLPSGQHKKTTVLFESCKHRPKKQHKEHCKNINIAQNLNGIQVGFYHR